ncbi:MULTISPECIES: putative baseplate assembly protein [unclassified Streptomyces]|uniref:putative baseplate assembly protein n=1 Tax=unclassified Streptomyces TaxID=2593676 RepID=UPI002DDB23A8|nr:MULTISPECIES: putative baseplate assembly protein [unclassified Streptomyces]WSC39884.1 putative baseplate assembly protein [Streptomyces sp. NBC_01763]WSF83832.1 putative baseplate assembly protein [Streptomyces sp. NBC_01744]WSJ50357.1 putative baseplate assembly protein [Streptomyces sp. NBC_01318]
MSGSCGCGCGGHDERHAPKALYNAPGHTALNYRVGEYGSFLAAMLDRLASPAYPALRGLTVRTPDDPSVGLLDAWAVVGDLLTFHSERIADEGYLRTADEHRSLALLGRLVGHRPRPGIAADTHLAYTLDRDPRAEDVPVLIPRGARANSVPSTSDEESQAFETSEDLIARWAWNELAVRRRRPALLTPDDLRKRPEIFVSGTGTSLQTGDRLLFVFGGDEDTPGQRLLLPVARIRIDRDDEVTAIGLPQSAPASLTELVAELRVWITEDQREAEEGEPTPDNPNPRPVSRIIEDFDAQVLAPLRADLGAIKTPAQFAARLVEPHDRLAEAQAIAAPYEEVTAWFEKLEAVVGELIERAAELEPSRPDTPAAASNSPAMQALGAVLPALRTRVVRPPSGARTLSHDPGRYFAPGSDLGAQLLSALDPRVADGMYAAWRRAAPAVPALLRDLQAMRVTATPFGATAPLKAVQDERGRVVRQTDWPLTGGALTAMRVVFDTAGRVPVSAEFQHVETGASVQVSENLPAEKTFPLGPGRISLMTRSAQDHDLSWLSRRPADSQEPGVTARLMSGLPERTLFVSRPGDDGRVHVAVHNGEPLERFLAPGEHQQIRHGGYEVTLRYTVGSEPANVEVGIATVPEQANRHVVALDSVYDGITVGSWVAIERPRKGADAPDGIPGDEKLKFVTSRVTAVRTAAYTNYGITGRGTELTLAEPWLDEHDVLLSAIRDATVHAGGEALRPADEPLGEDVHGNELELTELYDGLRPGRHLVVSGERTDIPDTAGVHGTELVVIAAVEQQLDPQLPGDHVHTKLTLTTDLAFRYRRDTLRIHGNVVPATHGESRDEPIGSGDAGRTNQTFTLWQAPLTWLPAGNPLGATPTLEVRVDGLLWHEVDSLAGRGPRERVYVSGTAGDGRTTVTFGDGMHGARLPTGHENVRAQYRFGTGRAANVGADRITQAMTRPLGVTAVTNPQPATGGAEADGPGLTRRTIPLAVSALDRLVSLTDYEDFARSRAGIGRAAAREIFDGRRRILHVTVAGIDDIAIADDSEVLRALRSSLADYGDSRLPVRVDVRELVLLLVAAKVKVAPDHTWTVVEPRLRQALLTQFGSGRRELGRPARLSEVLATAHAVPGVDYVDVDVFTGVPASVTPDELAGLADSLARPRTAVGARLAAYDEDVHRVTADDGETLTQVAARYGISLAELLRLNPDITDTRRLEKDRTVFVFRGIRPAQLALLSPHIADTLILTEVTA